MVLGSPLLHALSGLARARLGWLCPRAWGGELVVRVSNRLVRRAVGRLHGSGSVRGRGVLTGGCLAAGLTTASMAPKPRMKFTQDQKAHPGGGPDRSNRIRVNLPVMLVEALQRRYKTEDVTASSGEAGRAAEQSKHYAYHHKQSIALPSFTSSVAACFLWILKNLPDFLQIQNEVPERCLRSTALYGTMRAMHHLALRKTGRKPPVAKKTVAQDSWHSLHSVWHAQSVKEKCKGNQGCLQRGCFDLNCPRGNRCPKSQTQLRKAAQNQGA